MDKPNIPLKTRIVGSFVLLTTAAFLLIGIFVFNRWNVSVRQCIEKTHEDELKNVSGRIGAFISAPLKMNEFAEEILVNEALDIQNKAERERFFVSVLRQDIMTAYAFGYGTEDGGYYGAARNGTGGIEIVQSDGETGGRIVLYSVKYDLTAGQAVKEKEPYDARLTEWYRGAKEKGRTLLSDVYKSAASGTRAISAATPVYDESGRLKGVLSAQFLLSEINGLLKEVATANGGSVYIAEKNTGYLIAGFPETAASESGPERPSLLDAGDEHIADAYRKYMQTAQDSFEFKTIGETFHIRIFESPEPDLDWLVLIAVPESAFAAEMERSILVSTLMAAVALLVMVLLMTGYAGRKLEPIRELILASERFCGGDYSIRARVTAGDETGTLSEAFNKMADEICAQIGTLEENVALRTGDLEKNNAALRENELKLQLILDSTFEAIYGIDLNGNCTFCNLSCLKMLGYANQADLLGENMFRQIHHDCKNGVPTPLEEWEVLKALFDGKGAHADDEVLWRADGTSFDAEYFSYPQYKDGIIVGAVVTFIDITSRKKTESDIVYLSYHDPLTGLYNRRFCEVELRRLDTRRNLPISIIMGDVDGLKLTNDIFGHGAGDTLLRKLAEAIKGACRSDDIVARWGGDEFVVLLPKTDGARAEEIAKRIKKNFAKEYMHSISGSMSLGYETKTHPGEDIYKVLETAEKKMYAGKTLDRNNISSGAVRTLISTLHASSEAERTHSKNVSRICQKIGLALRLSTAEITKLKDVGYLHDIGKIVIERSLLSKSGMLTDQERQEIRQHSVVGYRILSFSDETLDLANLILAHHERWDGKGYPKGLKGRAIPKLARIVAIAESYDAMVNDKKMSHAEAVEEILKNAGTQFDPAIAEVFGGISEKEIEEEIPEK